MASLSTRRNAAQQIVLPTSADGGAALSENFAWIDAMQGGVKSQSETSPPSPTEGDLYILTGTPAGDWTGQSANDLALRYDSGWKYFTPPSSEAGISLYVIDEDTSYRWDGSSWAAITAAAMTESEIKAAYESNADTNAFTDAEKTKLSGVETNATADQSPAEIKAAYESNADTNAFTDAEKTSISNAMTSVVQDSSPQLGGDLDFNGFNVSGISASEISHLSGVSSNIQNQIDNIPTGTSDLVDDSSPQLGGDLDVNGRKILSTSNGDIVIDPHGSGQIQLTGDILVNPNATGRTFRVDSGGFDAVNISTTGRRCITTAKESGSGRVFGAWVAAQHSLSSGTTDQLVMGLNAFVYITGGANYTDDGILGGFYEVRHNGSGTISLAKGVQTSTGDINGSGSITEAFGFYVEAESGGNKTNEYGLYVQELNEASSSYAIYTEGTTPSRFEGPVRANSLEVDNAISSGTMFIDGSISGVDVSNVNTIFLDGSFGITIDSLTGGVPGQVLNLVSHVVFSGSSITIRHDDGTINQNIFLRGNTDKVIFEDYGGCILVCDGTNWYQTD